MLDNWLSIVKKYRLIGVIRTNNVSLGEKMALALAQGGIKIIEISWLSDQPDVLIKRLRNKLPDCYIGVGTILSISDLVAAIASGSQFAFSPHFDSELVDLAHSQNIPFIPGALSPSEIIKAFDYGAKTVKVFPIQSVGGINYLKNILAPTPHLNLIPTGGIKLVQALDFIRAGATAVGLATDLFPAQLIAQEDWQLISLRIANIQQQITTT